MALPKPRPRVVEPTGADAYPGYWRTDNLVRQVANLVLRLASPRYRAMTEGAIQYGLRAAVRDLQEGRPAP